MVMTGHIKFGSEKNWREVAYRETKDGIRIIRPNSEITLLKGVIGATVQLRLHAGDFTGTVTTLDLITRLRPMPPAE
jgi:hypothetical protein